MADPSGESPHRSPLHELHVDLGAKIVPFGGWDMPLSYDAGTLEEHRRCRTDAVVFDVSHLGTVRVSGPKAHAVLQETFTNDLERIEPGRAQYTHLLDPDDASVLDDIIVWWLDAETFDVMPNASNTDRVTDALAAADHVTEMTSTRAILAVQGPAARERLAAISPEAAEVGRFRVESFDWRGTACLVAGTGYTGEDGVELAVPLAVAEEVWSAVVRVGIMPAGLGARDTLRLEAGLPLHGHELGPGITPLQAGLGWVVRWDKPEFRGRAPLAAERDAGVSRRLAGLMVEGRRPPRGGQLVVRGDDVIGEVTSGNFSPTLERGIAMAFLPPDVEIGGIVDIDMRGTRTAAEIVAMPFVGR
ncbi:MAG: glycine cleavage system aminomethyltransferase GcvT [Acidimicrobiia bacterium]|nr:glycine cleavage system aminomethyltransferase GcvT [Acidimicrobiia bacterium]